MTRALRVRSMVVAGVAVAALTAGSLGMAQAAHVADGEIATSSWAQLPPPGTNQEGFFVVTKANYPSIMEMSRSKVVVLEFGGPGCGACEDLNPILMREHAASRGAWIFGTVDTNTEREVKKPYNIDALPTTIAIKDGKEFKRMRGFGGEAASIQWLKSVVGDSNPGRPIEPGPSDPGRPTSTGPSNPGRPTGPGQPTPTRWP